MGSKLKKKVTTPKKKEQNSRKRNKTQENRIKTQDKKGRKLTKLQAQGGGAVAPLPPPLVAAPAHKKSRITEFWDPLDSNRGFRRDSGHSLYPSLREAESDWTPWYLGGTFCVQ